MDKFFSRKNKDGTVGEPAPSAAKSVEKKSKIPEKKEEAKTGSSPLLGAAKTARFITYDFSKLLESGSFKPAKVELTTKEPSPLPFGLIADAFELVAKKSGQNSQEYKKEIMAKVFELVLEKAPSDLVSVYDFCLLRTNVLWLQRDLGIGGQTLTKAVVTVTGRTLAKVREDFQEKGCLGTVLEESREGQHTFGSMYGIKKKETNLPDETQGGKELVTFRWVFEALKSLGEISGSGSQGLKEETLVKLFRAATPREGKFIARFVDGNLKIGFAEKMFQASLARALARYFRRNKLDYVRDDMDGDGDDKDLFAFWEEALQKCFTQFPDQHTFLHHLIANKSLTQTQKLCRLTPGVPCKPMLAKPTTSLKQVFDRFEGRRFTCEYKYDGLRGQIHYDRNTGLLRIFSRNLEDMTLQYPDIALSIGEFVGDHDVIDKVRFLAGQLAEKSNLGPSASKKSPEKTDDGMDVEIEGPKIDSIIIDSEIVAYDRVKNRILPFQILATRGRKNVNANDQVSVCIFIFDVLYLNGKALINEPLNARRQVIRERIDTCAGKLKTGMIRSANYADCANIEELGKYLDESIVAGCEGLMVKTLEENATYEPAKRSFKWLKVKKDYLDRNGLGDSFDLVVVGAKFGEGKRAGKYGSYLMACYNPNSGDYECTVYVGGGFSDEQLAEFHNLFKDKALKDKPKNVLVEKDSYPDVWLSPEQVFEIKAADILISPSYKAARGEIGDSKGSGLALRFARFMRWRKDKTATSASDSKFMYDVYKSQALVKEPELDDDDYY